MSMSLYLGCQSLVVGWFWFFSFFGIHLHVNQGNQCVVVLFKPDLFIYKKETKTNRKGFDISISATSSGISEGAG